MSDFEKLQEELPRKEKLYSSLIDRRINYKENKIVLMFAKNLK